MKADRENWLFLVNGVFATGIILSMESNQNVESKIEKCGVQNSNFISRNRLF